MGDTGERDHGLTRGRDGVPPRRVFRMRFVQLGLGVCYGGLALCALLGVTAPDTPALAQVVMMAIALASAVLSWRGFVTCAVHSSPSGVKIVNFLSTFKAAWPEIERVEAVDRRNGQRRPGMALDVLLTSGRRSPVSYFWCPMRASGEPNRCVEIADLINADLAKVRAASP